MPIKQIAGLAPPLTLPIRLLKRIGSFICAAILLSLISQNPMSRRVIEGTPPRKGYRQTLFSLD